MDVTSSINQIQNTYGGGSNSIANALSSSKALNFAEGGSIQKAVKTGIITQLPFVFNFKGTVGSFGANNQFFEISTNIIDYGIGSATRGDYKQGVIYRQEDTDPYYDAVVIDYDSDLEPVVNTFLKAEISDELSSILKPVFSLSLINNGSGNKYEDCWLDTRLYSKYKEEHPYDEMLFRDKDKFYIGFHARNTRRLDYDVQLVLGLEYMSEYELNEQERKLLTKQIY